MYTLVTVLVLEYRVRILGWDIVGGVARRGQNWPKPMPEMDSTEKTGLVTSTSFSLSSVSNVPKIGLQDEINSVAFARLVHH